MSLVRHVITSNLPWYSNCQTSYQPWKPRKQRIISLPHKLFRHYFRALVHILPWDLFSKIKTFVVFYSSLTALRGIYNLISLLSLTITRSSSFIITLTTASLSSFPCLIAPVKHYLSEIDLYCSQTCSVMHCVVPSPWHQWSQPSLCESQIRKCI